MLACFLTIALGILMIVMGAVNCTGNINSLHSYHRKRVREEDKKPLGRAVGLGMFFTGGGCIFFGAVMLIYELCAIRWLEWLAPAGLLAGVGVGSVIVCRAIVKYNKGLF